MSSSSLVTGLQFWVKSVTQEDLLVWASYTVEDLYVSEKRNRIACFVAYTC